MGFRASFIGVGIATCMLLPGWLSVAGESGADRVFEPTGLSTDVFDAVPFDAPERVDVVAHDGVALHVRLYRPDTSGVPGWRTPVILVHSVYFGRFVQDVVTGMVDDAAGSAGEQRSERLVAFFTPKGYAVALADVRGTGHSGGCFEADGSRQAQDFATLVAHFATQAWSNGKVGAYGKSYDAEAANAGAVLSPDGLAAMVTVAGISGLYEVAYFDGVPLVPLLPYLDGGSLYAGGAASGLLYFLNSVDPPSDPGRWPLWAERLPCAPEHVLAQSDPAGTMNAYFLEREFRRGVAAVEASVLYVQGFGDSAVRPVNMVGWYDELPGPKKAILGQWAHHEPDKAPDPWRRTDWMRTLHAFFDGTLLGLPTGWREWPPVQVQDERAAWRWEHSFKGLGKQRAYPLGLGTLGEPGPAGATMAFDEFGAPGAEAVVWHSEPLAAPLHVSGMVELEVTVSLDRTDAHFAVLLRELPQEGEARALTRGYLSAPHRDSLEAPSDVPVATPIQYRLRTIPTDRWVEAGSRLELVLAGHDIHTLPAASGYHAEVAVDGASVLRLPVTADHRSLTLR